MAQGRRDQKGRGCLHRPVSRALPPPIWLRPGIARDAPDYGFVRRQGSKSPRIGEYQPVLAASLAFESAHGAGALAGGQSDGGRRRRRAGIGIETRAATGPVMGFPAFPGGRYEFSDAESH
jgi:hypothetical protein